MRQTAILLVLWCWSAFGQGAAGQVNAAGEANQALALGLVNRVVPAASLMAETAALAKRIASGPAIAYSYMKANINAALTADLRTLLDREAVGQALTGRTEDHKEAVQAFLEKRQPTFKGR
jgi:2-(1,2-epoxy-1,2-dihydrophenyl)acetyl-CoA isomerase